MFAIGGIVYAKSLPADPRVRILGMPNRLAIGLGFSIFSVFVEVLLHATGFFHWDYWWWNWPFVPLIVVFGYLWFFLVAAWVYDMRDTRRQVRDGDDLRSDRPGADPDLRPGARLDLDRYADGKSAISVARPDRGKCRPSCSAGDDPCNLRVYRRDELGRLGQLLSHIRPSVGTLKRTSCDRPFTGALHDQRRARSATARQEILVLLGERASPTLRRTCDSQISRCKICTAQMRFSWAKDGISTRGSLEQRIESTRQLYDGVRIDIDETAARSGRGLVAHPVFKTGRPVQPTGWKVRFLRRSVVRPDDPRRPAVAGRPCARPGAPAHPRRMRARRSGAAASR